MGTVNTISVSGYLAHRLAELGLGTYFAVPGDFNLILLDEFLKQKDLKAIYCCNELNAGYAADGYARAHGLAAVSVTYSVGGLSLINAIAGAYAEDLPIVVISGSPKSSSQSDHLIIHHALGKTDYDYVRRMYAEVTVDAITIDSADSAGRIIDRALARALHYRKPVYIEIPCNVANLQITAPTSKLMLIDIPTSPETLKKAVEHAASLLNQAVKPLLVAGPKLRTFSGKADFDALIKASGYAYANQPQAKGFVDETDPQYIGTYWGSVSSPGCGEIVESSDLCIYVGSVFTDYSTVGYTALVKPDHSIFVGSDTVIIKGAVYNQIHMNDFLAALAKSVKKNSAAIEAYRRIQGEAPPVSKPEDSADVSTRYLFSQIQNLLDKNTTVFAETGDSWFNGMWLKLPKGCLFEIQMQYGSIGWCTGATLGYQAAVAGERRVIALTGDGSFQLTAQEVSTMLRYGMKPIIFLMNNKGYTIEVEIHDGPYNKINNWNYAQVIESFNNQQYKCLTKQAKTVGELDEAIKAAKSFDGLCFIEVHLHPDDCNKNLLKWGGYVAKFNSEKPSVF